jgi:hypothetical protein
MTSQIKHSALPWISEVPELEGFNGEHYTYPANFSLIVLDDNEYGNNVIEVNGVNHEANAAFIVKAVNNYDALVSFVEYILEQYRHIGKDSYDNDEVAHKAEALLNKISKE